MTDAQFEAFVAPLHDERMIEIVEPYVNRRGEDEVDALELTSMQKLLERARIPVMTRTNTLHGKHYYAPRWAVLALRTVSLQDLTLHGPESPVHTFQRQVVAVVRRARMDRDVRDALLAAIDADLVVSFARQFATEEIK